MVRWRGGSVVRAAGGGGLRQSVKPPGEPKRTGTGDSAASSEPSGFN